MARMLRVSGVLVLSAALIVPAIVGAQSGGGFEGYIQSGTCAKPTDALRVKLVSEGDGPDVAPYKAKSGNGTTDLGYYGAPTAPGFGFSAIYADQQFSLVLADAGSGKAVACGDLLEPDNDDFGEAGTAAVQLLPVGTAKVQGVAMVERGQLERELNVTPTRVRILLSNNGEVAKQSGTADGFDAYIQGGTCKAPGDRVRVQLKGENEPDVKPYLAKSPGSGQPVTVAYYGARFAPGYGLAATYTDQDFSLAVTGTDGGDPVACGDILEPNNDDFGEAGLVLVQLQPVGDSSPEGYALIERINVQRELSATPTRVRIVLFAPPVR
jgi:hypothetical protein